MFCKNCGNQVKDGIAFCNNCGTPLAQGETVHIEDVPLKKVLIGIAVVALVILLGGLKLFGKDFNEGFNDGFAEAEETVAEAEDWLSGNWVWDNGDLTEEQSFRLELQVAGGKITGRYIAEDIIGYVESKVEGSVKNEIAVVSYSIYCDDEYTGTGKAVIKKLNDNEIMWKNIQKADCGNHTIQESDESGDYTPDKVVLKKVTGSNR
jgi:uncharacterized membrane protein YvbJ